MLDTFDERAPFGHGGLEPALSWPWAHVWVTLGLFIAPWVPVWGANHFVGKDRASDRPRGQ